MNRRRLSVVVVVAVGALTLVALPSALAGGGGGCHRGDHTQDRTGVVDIKANCFTPTVTAVDVGDTVEWTNSDDYTHVIAGATGEWSSAEMAGTESTGVRFDTPGVFPYWCTYHPGMIGAVVVGDGNLDAKAAEGGPVARAVFSTDEPPSGGAATNPDQTSGTRSSDGPAAPVAAVAIAVLAGAAGFGLALVLRRRRIAVSGAKSLG